MDPTPARRGPTLVPRPARAPAAGTPPKSISEYVGHLSTATGAVSVAVMRSPAGWSEPGQTPDFDEYTVVLEGALQVHWGGGTLEVRAGQAVVAHAGEWVRYSTSEECEYVAVCVPAFTPEAAHRDGS